MANTAAKENLRKDKLTNRNLWCFSLGGVGRDMAYGMWNSFILTCILLTKNLTVAQFGIVSGLVIVCRVLAGLNDPILGGLVESTSTKWGKFKPWILLGAITNSVILCLTFAVPLYGNDFVIFFPFAYLIWDVTYTMNDIGYWSMMPALTSDSRDRDRLSTISLVCAGAGAGIVSIAVPFLTTGDFAIGGSAVTAYRVLPVMVALIFLACQLMTCAAVKEKPQILTAPKPERAGVRRMFGVIKGNDQLGWISVCLLLYNAGANLVSVGFLTYYIYFNYGYQGAAMLVFTIISGAAAAITVFYPMLSKRFTRKQIMKGCFLFAAAGYLGMLLTGLLWTGRGSYFMLAACMAAVSVGQSIIYMVLTVSAANTVEYNAVRTGKRDDGIIFSIRHFMAKMGSALQMAIVAVVFAILKIADITNSISQLENQAAMGLITKGEKAELIGGIIEAVPDFTNKWMIVCMAVIPLALIGILVLIYLKKYKLDEKTYGEIIDKLNTEKTDDIGVSIEPIPNEPTSVNACECASEKLEED